MVSEIMASDRFFALKMLFYMHGGSMNRVKPGVYKVSFSDGRWFYIDEWALRAMDHLDFINTFMIHGFNLDRYEPFRSEEEVF